MITILCTKLKYEQNRYNNIIRYKLIIIIKYYNKMFLIDLVTKSKSNDRHCAHLIRFFVEVDINNHQMQFLYCSHALHIPQR